MEPVLDRQRRSRLPVPLPSEKNPLNDRPARLRAGTSYPSLALRSGLEEQQPILPVAGC
jgi:hypothetical protein